MIIIYRLKNIGSEIKAIEIDKWDNGEFQGIFSSRKMTKSEVIDRFNRGYWRTGDVKE
jgi:hypothetical protein